MFYVVNNHLNDLSVLSNRAVGPGKKSKINKPSLGPIPEARVRPPRFWQNRKHHPAAVAGCITTCPLRFSDLAPSLKR